MVDVFISYKREERDAITLIAERLRALKLEVWFDDQLRQGPAFDQEIAAKLAEAKCVLVCWTPAALDSEWVRGEAALAHGDGKLVACFLEPTRLIPPFNLQQTEDLMRWAGQEDDPAWIRLLTGIGERVGRPGVATFASVMAVGSPVAALRTWAAAHGADPSAESVWARIRILEGESSADRIEREQIEARTRGQRRQADDARSKALARARGLRDPAEQRRRLRRLAAAIGAIGLVAFGGVVYSIDAQNRAARLGRASSPQELRAFLSANGWHPIATEAMRKYRALDAAAWAAARASGTLSALRAYQKDFAETPEGEFISDAKILEANAEQVRRAQLALARLQIYRGDPHGSLDPPTRESIESFRFRSGAPVSGTVDGDLLASLDRVIASLPTVPPSMLVARRSGPAGEEDYRILAARTGLDAPTLYAVRRVESGSRPGFGPDGKPVLTFEPGLFSRSTKGVYDDEHPQVSSRRLTYPVDQAARWKQLEEAYALDPKAAYEASCLGTFQICGLNYGRLGFGSPGEMSWFVSQSEANQVEVFVRFVENAGLLPLLKAKEWDRFGRRYVGGAHYGPRLAAAYAEGMRSLGFFVPEANAPAKAVDTR